MIRRFVSGMGIADGFFPRLRGRGEQPAIQALLCLLFATCLWPQVASAFQIQSANGSHAAEEPAIYRIQGTVVNSLTGEPVYRALVTIHAQQPRAVLTDQDGRFVIDGLPKLETAVSAQKPGYFDGQDWNRSNQTLIQIGANTDPLLLKLIPEAVIVGHVSDEHGEPLERVRVKLSTFRIVNGRKQWQQSGVTVTNDDGEYRIANLRRGEYYISAGPTQNRSLLQPGAPSSDPTYPLTYYPDAFDTRASSPVQLSPGDHAQADFSLKPARGFMLSGTVNGSGERAGVSLSFMNQSGDDAATARLFDPRTGKFEARIAGAGLCTIKARYQEGTSVLVGETTINVNSDIANVVLNLGPTGDIPVTVQQAKVASDASPIRKRGYATSGFGTGNVPLSIRIVSDKTGSQMGYVQQRGPQDPSLHIANLEPGSYRVEANAYQPWYVYSMTSGGVDLLREPFVVAPGESQGIDVVLRDDIGILEATIHYIGDHKKAAVLIIPERAPLYPKVTTLFERATFPMSLAPGDYKILAFDSVDELEYMNPEALRPYLPKAATVSVLPEQKASVDVEVIRVQQP